MYSSLTLYDPNSKLTFKGFKNKKYCDIYNNNTPNWNWLSMQTLNIAIMGEILI